MGDTPRHRTCGLLVAPLGLLRWGWTGVRVSGHVPGPWSQQPKGSQWNGGDWKGERAASAHFIFLFSII